jgi:hypothetical protein
MQYTTTSTFGQLQQAGIKCEIVASNSTSVLIKTESGNIYWGREKDLVSQEQETKIINNIEQGIINACFKK